jgi:hypothetical protein
MKKNTAGLLTVLSMLIVLGSILIPILVHNRNTSLQFDKNATLAIFTLEEDLVELSATAFYDLTNHTLKMNSKLLLEQLNASVTETITIISTDDDYQKIPKGKISNYTLVLNTQGYIIQEEQKTTVNVIGLAIDIPKMTVDIAPTIYQALGFNDWGAHGEAITIPNAGSYNKVAVFLLDGFGWQFWKNLTALELIGLHYQPFYNQAALTVYPSITNVATASIVSGYWPSESGIYGRNDHILQAPTIFDIAAENNLTTEFFEGSVGFLNFQADYEHWLLDDDGDGLTDDEIFTEANQSLSENRSECLFIHFHGIDDVGHAYGPNSPEWLNKVQEVFNMTNDLLKRMDNQTLVVLTADHGMHTIPPEEQIDYRVGAHGDCRNEDMIVPLIFLRPNN